jgi:catechol 2,3-dioxygenase-like lactoylglutathione lyase family enzyme
MKLTRLDHSALIVDDLARTRHFYGEVLGLEEIPRPASFKFGGCWFRGPDFELHFILARDTTAPTGFGDPGPGGRNGLAHHLAFAVDDLDEAEQRFASFGIPLAAGPFQRGDGIVQLYVNDPDGHFLEFFARVERQDVPWADREAVPATSAGRSAPLA